MAYCEQADTLDDLMRRVVQEIIDSGEENAPTKGRTLEIVAATLELTNPRARISRTETRRKVVSALGELCWYLSGSNDAEPISYYINQYNDYVELDGSIHGGYGPRLFGDGVNAQIWNIVDLLREKSTSRRAMVQIFDRTDIAPGTGYLDIPCTSTIQFLVRGDRLHVVVNMRSNDAYLGFPHDVFAFTMIQEIVARELDVEVGRYVHLAGSLHLYTEKIDQVQKFLSEGWQSTVDYMPPMPIGSQKDNIAQLLTVEAQLRSGVAITEVQFPEDPYWADLARVLAMYAAQRHSMNDDVKSAISKSFNHRAFSEFV